MPQHMFCIHFVNKCVYLRKKPRFIAVVILCRKKACGIIFSGAVTWRLTATGWHARCKMNTCGLESLKSF